MKLDAGRMHPLREQLNEEIHWLPYEPVRAPAAAVFLLATDVSADDERRWRERLCSGGAAVAGESGDGVQRIDGDGWRLLIQRHVETTRYLFLAEARASAPAPEHPFAGAPWDRLPQSAIAEAPGRILTAARLALLRDAGDGPEAWAMLARRVFDRPVAGGCMGRSGSAVFSDFQNDADGFIRYLIIARAELPAQNGRLLGRLLDIEAYRMLTLLGLPAARELLDELPRLEDEFQRLAGEIGDARHVADATVLDDLLTLGLKVERHMSEQARRLSASRAYFELLQRRLDDLGEQPLPSVAPMRAFLNRRLESAHDTIQDVGRWLERLSARIGAVGDLLRTRVNVRQEEQNQELLAALNRRFSLQLRLQQAAELLSVAIFTYYSSHLLADVAELAAHALGGEIDPLSVRGATAPLLAIGAVWWLLRRRKRRSAHT